MDPCIVCGNEELGKFGKISSPKPDHSFLLCERCYKTYWKEYQHFRNDYRHQYWKDPYKDVELKEGQVVPAGCYLCGSIEDVESHRLGSQHYKCPSCLRMVNAFNVRHIRDHRPKKKTKKWKCKACGTTDQYKQVRGEDGPIDFCSTCYFTQQTLEQFYDHSVISQKKLQSDTSKKMEVN